MKNPFKGTQKNQQLQILAVELALAGGEVLKEEFNFTDAQVALWMDKLLNRAKTNRAKNNKAVFLALSEGMEIRNKE